MWYFSFFVDFHLYCALFMWHTQNLWRSTRIGWAFVAPLPRYLFAVLQILNCLRYRYAIVNHVVSTAWAAALSVRLQVPFLD